MALYGKSLNSVSVTGPGSAIFFDDPKAHFSMVVTGTGITANTAVALEVSLDGSTFVAITSLSGTAGSPQLVYPYQGYAIPMIAARANVTNLDGATNISAVVGAA